jgi:GTP-binding protein HflX
MKQTTYCKRSNRIIKDKIKAIDKQMGTQRGNRGAMVRVALVGY